MEGLVKVSGKATGLYTRPAVKDFSRQKCLGELSHTSLFQISQIQNIFPGTYSHHFILLIKKFI